MKPAEHVVVIGAAIVRNGRMLLVRKRGLGSLILPGGKPEIHEDDVTALRRELVEELGCDARPDSISALGVFRDRSADGGGRMVEVRLYAADLDATPVAAAELEQLLWLDRAGLATASLAPSIWRSIVPELVSRGML